MPYGLVVNGALRDMGDVKYLLSPQVRLDLSFLHACTTWLLLVLQRESLLPTKNSSAC